MPSSLQTQLFCNSWSLGWGALASSIQPYTASTGDNPGSAPLPMLALEETHRQIDWPAQQTSLLVCSLAGQKCRECWENVYARTSWSVTALTVWRKEEWRNEVVDIPPAEIRNSLCTTRPTLVLFQAQGWRHVWKDTVQHIWAFQRARMLFWDETETDLKT